MLTNEQYKNYVGQYVKRFYTPFREQYIFKIAKFRVNEVYQRTEYFYECEKDESESGWYDCLDSCVITNEKPVKRLKWVANVNDRDYSGFNPFTRQLIISNTLN